MKIIPVSDFDPNAILLSCRTLKRHRGVRAKGPARRYKDIVTAFDIETTTFRPEMQAAMYIWQWAFEDIVVIGRTWDDFLGLCQRITLCLEEKEYVVVFVHNLSFEFQFLRGIYQFRDDEIFATEPRSILKCSMFDHIELRCSYRHSNMTLGEFTHTMKVDHQKLTGELDYTIERYPWSEMSGKDLAYCVNDVAGLVEAIHVEMDKDNDDLYSLPITSTGYVRRDAKRSLREFHYRLQYMLPTVDQYMILRESFRGGNVHANRFLAGVILDQVSSADRSSSYPDVMCNNPFPMGEWTRADDGISVDDIERLSETGRKAFFFRIRIWGLQLQDPYWPCPYLSRDKCRHIVGARYDNGRILECEYLETSLTDIDLRILLSEYRFDAAYVFDCWYTYYKMLPEDFTDCIKDYYRLKTALKGDPDREYLYGKSKAKLNSLYGMTATSAHMPLHYNNGCWDYIELSADEQADFQYRHPVTYEMLADALEEYNRTAFLPYTWGVWTTAWARLRLEEGIRLAGENFVYADTDSVKYLGSIDWSGFNGDRIRDSVLSGAYADDSKGYRHYMGVFEFEETYSRFRTWGAKKYAYEDKCGQLHITVAGVSKKTGAEELGTLENFRSGFTFTRAGGMRAIYNDAPEITKVIREGREIPITSNVVLEPTTYTLGLAADYEMLLNHPEYFLDFE